MNGLLVIFGLLALLCLAALYFAAVFLTKSISGDKYKRRNAILLACFGYALVGLIVYWNFKKF